MTFDGVYDGKELYTEWFGTPDNIIAHPLTEKETVEHQRTVAVTIKTQTVSHTHVKDIPSLIPTTVVTKTRPTQHLTQTTTSVTIPPKKALKEHLKSNYTQISIPFILKRATLTHKTNRDIDQEIKKQGRENIIQEFENYSKTGKRTLCCGWWAMPEASKPELSTQKYAWKNEAEQIEFMTSDLFNNYLQLVYIGTGKKGAGGPRINKLNAEDHRIRNGLNDLKKGLLNRNRYKMSYTKNKGSIAYEMSKVQSG